MDFIDDFIMEYRNNPCLWNANSIHFKNKTKRQEAYLKLIDIASKHGEHYNIERTKQKINNLRCAFRHQLKKYTEFKRKTGKDEPYCPKRRYFESLMFLMEEENKAVGNILVKTLAQKNPDEQFLSEESTGKESSRQYRLTSDLKSSLEINKKDIVSKSVSKTFQKLEDNSIQVNVDRNFNIRNSSATKNTLAGEVNLNEVPTGYNALSDMEWPEKKTITKLINFEVTSQHIDDDNGIHTSGEQNHRQGSMSPSSHISNESESYPVKCVKVDCTSKNFQKLLALACYNLEKSTDDKFSNFGKIVADKLRSLNPQQAVFAEKLIYDVLFQGHLGLLSASSIEHFSLSQ